MSCFLWSRASRTLRSFPFSQAALARRCISSQAALRRSYLYVPSGSERMLQKSLGTGADVIVYDLEDSVAPSPEDKANARANLKKFLKETDVGPHSPQIAVRVNDISTPFFAEDITEVVSNIKVKAVVLAKTHSAEDLDVISTAIREAPHADVRGLPIEIIPSLESARAMWNLRDIASWKSKHEPRFGGELGALMFACEDYCADTGIVRTPSRRELLYTRSQIVLAAKAFGLDAIDMVCIQYKDKDYLKEECVDGRQLGFTGKQAIHPSQIPIIQRTYGPTPEEILRAAKILKGLKEAHASEKGAIGIDGEMIDAPMLKQAEKIIAVAEAAGLDIPTV
ncbi:beta subunit of citrate lyase [Coprinellus micaceus]|uniref:Beta subunit of citrate lyase n=1 Tax=Coprinellus micaceus TaxID=71717 RepID=A0A4Y7U0A3_COPMI|nr:beta subunit of citrate lyase [Coprinellus micaceus]